ncbi:putative leader peptide [Kitasatospora sp. NPDC058965]
MRQTRRKPAVVTVKARCRVTTTSARLHIDLQRVTTALCPALKHAVA